MYTIPCVPTGIRRMGEGWHDKRSTMLWLQKKPWNLARAWVFNLGTKPEVAGRKPPVTAHPWLCCVWCSPTHHCPAPFPLVVFVCYPVLSWKQLLRPPIHSPFHDKGGWAEIRTILQLAALALLVRDQTKPVVYPSIRCLHGHFAFTGFCNFSFNISFLFIRNPTFLLSCEIKKTESSQPCIKQQHHA